MFCQISGPIQANLRFDIMGQNHRELLRLRPPWPAPWVGFAALLLIGQTPRLRTSFRLAENRRNLYRSDLGIAGFK
jgi:hypothetical protein